MIAGGGIAFLVFAKLRLSRKLVAVAAFAPVLVVAGASFHYLMNPEIRRAIDRSVQPERVWELANRLAALSRPKLAESRGRASSEDAASARLATERAPPPTKRVDVGTASARLATERAPPPTKRVDVGMVGTIELRGQGVEPLQQLIFGRLQMFTGFEYFSWIFFLFWAGVVVRLWRRPVDFVDIILITAAVTTTLFVVSGVRVSSWSNPRYIASVLPIAAYFAGPTMEALERRFLTGSWRRLLAGALLASPLILTLSIRGAKVEITNSGDFYRDFRSLRWLAYARESPGEALATFWDEYLGIRKTIRYFLADRDDQLRHAHDHLAGVLWIRDNLPEDAHVMVFRDARFFYYSGHYGSVWYSPEIGAHEFRSSATAEALQSHLHEAGITHVLVDDFSKQMLGYVDSAIGNVLDDPRLSEKIYEFGKARVYRLQKFTLEPGEKPREEP